MIMSLSGIVLFAASAYDLFGAKQLLLPLTVTMLIIGVIAAFMGPALIAFPFREERRKRAAKNSLVLSVFFILFGWGCVFLHLPGARVEIIFGVLILCFFYGTLTFKNKFEKWRKYTRSSRDAFFLCLFDFLGIGCLLLGLLFRIQNWPLSQLMTVIGLVVMAIGTFSWNQKFKKEVVFRKETEDKLKESLEEIETQHRHLEEKQKEIIDSITYARRIQKSLLPTESYIRKTMQRLNKNMKN
ncbi:MAG: protein serine/threonine phosphatase [Bacteroidetes bacterium]|nr:protein serine/threonine phosphatase [Bacteroidota bacterium]